MDLFLLLAATMPQVRGLLEDDGLVVVSNGTVRRGDWDVGQVYENTFDDDGELNYGDYSVVFALRWLRDGSAEPFARHLFEAAKHAGYAAMLVADLAEKLDEYRPAA